MRSPMGTTMTMMSALTYLLAREFRKTAVKRIGNKNLLL